MKKTFLSGTVIFIGVFLATVSYADPTYHRLWLGYKLSSLTTEEFQSTINNMFIPKMIEEGSQKGLIAYQPALTIGIKSLPDEIALESYINQTAYNNVYQSDAGKAYVSLYSQYFDLSKSKSIAPERYLGYLQTGHAYDFHPYYRGWPLGKNFLRVNFRGPTETAVHFIGRMKARLDDAAFPLGDASRSILDRVAYLNKNYELEFISYKPDSVPDQSSSDLSIPLPNKPLNQVNLQPGQGVNIAFFK